MKRLVVMVLCGVLAFSMAGCGGKGDDTQKGSQSEIQSENTEDNTQPEKEDTQPEGNDTQPGGNEDQTGGDALSLMTTIWNNFPEDNKFPCFGGNQNENAVEGAAGKFDISDTNGMTNLLLIPEEIQGNVDDAATLIHMMNLNTFTGAVLHLTDGSTADAADKIKDKVCNNHFVCGAPTKIAVLTSGDYVMYVFGADDLVDSFANVAKEKIEGATVVYHEPIG